MNRQKQERARQNIFRAIAFGLMFLLLATSIAGIASILFQNSPLDETGSGENNVELANTLVSNPSSSSTYTLTTKQDLQNWASNSGYWASGKTTVLAADIDWGGSGGGNWPYVSNFSGEFNGNNKIIKNLYYNGSGTNIGFIGTVPTSSAATIKNLGLININFTTSGQVIAGMVAYRAGSSGSSILLTIQNCFITGEITTTHSTGVAGGLIAYSTSSSTPSYSGSAWTSPIRITECFNMATIKASGGTGTWAGGLFGYVNNQFNSGTYGSYSSSNPTINKCFNAGNITAGNAGGIAGGVQSSNGTVYLNDIYNTGRIVATSKSGGLYADGNPAGNSGGPDTLRSYNAGTVSGGTTGGLLGGSSNRSFNSSYTSNGVVTNGGTQASQANMLADNTLTSSMSGLGTSNWYKRPADGVQYYPELKAFAEHSWELMRKASKASVVASGPIDPFANQAPEFTDPGEVNIGYFEGDTTKTFTIDNTYLNAKDVNSPLRTFKWQNVSIVSGSEYFEIVNAGTVTADSKILLKPKYSDQDRSNLTLRFELYHDADASGQGRERLTTVVTLSIKVEKTPNIITII